MRSGFLPLFSLLGAVSVLAASGNHTHYSVKQSVSPPRGWVRQGAPLPGHNIQLRIGLPQSNFATLEQHLFEVSDPEHERYGQHLSKEEVEELVAPHPTSLHAVNEWLAGYGIGEEDIIRSPAQDWIKMNVPVELAERLLNTTYHVWRHIETGEQIVRTTSYSLPIDLLEHVEVVQPTTMFGLLKPFRSTVHMLDDSNLLPFESDPSFAGVSGKINNPVTGLPIDASCDRNITISCLQQLYNFTNYTPSADIGNGIGITGYADQFANHEDLQSFYKEQRPEAVGTGFQVVSINGGSNSQNLSEAGIEADLDIEYAFGLSFPIHGTFYSTEGQPVFIPDANTPSDTNEPFGAWLDFVLEQHHLPYSISTSYIDEEQTIPEGDARRLCAGFAQLGARGVSLFFAVGDAGVGGINPNPLNQGCLTNDGRNITRFLPTFPTSCPYVTSVGATTGIAPEVAVKSFGSGGGFSDYFPQPDYQHKAVGQFLRGLPEDTYEGLFNREGRAYPDVSLQGDRYLVYFRSQRGFIGGTSASAPSFGAIVALLNDVRLKAGKPPLGFLNPLLYSSGLKGLTDIVAGNNPGCGTQGFNATAGWDPVTGLGTPDFGVLKDIVLHH